MRWMTIARFTLMQVSVALAFPLLWFGHLVGLWAAVAAGVILGITKPRNFKGEQA